MLGIIADLLASLVTILFPVFASYKALKSSDPAQLAPWCMYWVVLSLILLFESWTVFIIGWVPFYSWFRLFFLSYLVLPQTQGAKLLYFEYISPFIERHEHDIEVFISNAHERAAAAGLSSIKKLIDLFREKVLGLPSPQAAQPPPPQTYGDAAAAYAGNLLSRFSIPQARMPGVPLPTTDIYALLSSALLSPSASGTSKPSDPAEKLSFLATQRERLTQMLTALDREQSALATETSMEADIDARMASLDPTAAVESHLRNKRNRSEHSFENIDRDEFSEGETGHRRPVASSGDGRSRRTVSGGWIPTWLGGAAAADVVNEDPRTEREEGTSARSSGMEIEDR